MGGPPGEPGVDEAEPGKGDFLNDLLGLILEGCAGVDLYSRGGVHGLVFPNHNLDVTYPNTEQSGPAGAQTR